MIIQIIALWTEWSIPVTNHKSFNWFSVLWLCVFSHRKVQSFLFLKDRNKDAELLQNAWLFNPRVVWASISVNESFRLLNSVGGDRVSWQPMSKTSLFVEEWRTVGNIRWSIWSRRSHLPPEDEWWRSREASGSPSRSLLKTNEGRVRAYYHLIQPSHLSSDGARLLIREEISGKSTYDRQ